MVVGCECVHESVDFSILHFIILNDILIEKSYCDPAAKYLLVHLQDRKGGHFW